MFGCFYKVCLVQLLRDGLCGEKGRLAGECLTSGQGHRMAAKRSFGVAKEDLLMNAWGREARF